MNDTFAIVYSHIKIETRTLAIYKGLQIKMNPQRFFSKNEAPPLIKMKGAIVNSNLNVPQYGFFLNSNEKIELLYNIDV